MDTDTIDLLCACGRLWRLIWPRRNGYDPGPLQRCPACSGNRVRFNHPATRLG